VNWLEPKPRGNSRAVFSHDTLRFSFFDDVFNVFDYAADYQKARDGKILRLKTKAGTNLSIRARFSFPLNPHKRAANFVRRQAVASAQ
jgi:hypothetical protein